MRDPGNAYRQYSENDIGTLKLIRILRMLDMPLDDIRRVVQESEVMPQALQEQEQRLRKQSEMLQVAIRYCRILKTTGQNDGCLDVDACLTRMEEYAQPNGFFAGWIYDYIRVAEHRMKRVSLLFLTARLLMRVNSRKHCGDGHKGSRQEYCGYSGKHVSSLSSGWQGV